MILRLKTRESRSLPGLPIASSLFPHPPTPRPSKPGRFGVRTSARPLIGKGTNARRSAGEPAGRGHATRCGTTHGRKHRADRLGPSFRPQLHRRGGGSRRDAGLEPPGAGRRAERGTRLVHANTAPPATRPPPRAKGRVCQRRGREAERPGTRRTTDQARARQRRHAGASAAAEHG